MFFLFLKVNQGYELVLVVFGAFIPFFRQPLKIHSILLHAPIYPMNIFNRCIVVRRRCFDVIDPLVFIIWNFPTWYLILVSLYNNLRRLITISLLFPVFFLDSYMRIRRCFVFSLILLPLAVMNFFFLHSPSWVPF